VIVPFVSMLISASQIDLRIITGPSCSEMNGVRVRLKAKAFFVGSCPATLPEGKGALVVQPGHDDGAAPRVALGERNQHLVPLDEGLDQVLRCMCAALAGGSLLQESSQRAASQRSGARGHVALAARGAHLRTFACSVDGRSSAVHRLL
jgi:hypothetical protein